VLAARAIAPSAQKPSIHLFSVGCAQKRVRWAHFEDFDDLPPFCGEVVDFIGHINPLSMYKSPLFFVGNLLILLSRLVFESSIASFHSPVAGDC
jgi:hypothetical protein